ncbi:MAG: WYL domain-containing protein, partial [Desulfobacterales bacterium]|nr:WYL domain-containing protein [Desulfobacterales bacterium]
RRKVAPYKIWYFNGAFYLIGYCRLRDDIRIFALDRIKSLERTEETFEAPADFDAEEFMRASFGVFQGEPVHVKVRFAPEIGGFISEKIWHASQKLYSMEDGSVIFEADVAGVKEIKFWIMTWGAKAEVLEPESLRRDIQREAAEMTVLYGDGGGRVNC